MFILDKKFIEKTDYSWFANKLDDNFKIELNNESMVIFGYNGIGKVLFLTVSNLPIMNTLIIWIMILVMIKYLATLNLRLV